MLRICLWSGPRNVSTALMYSFAQRRDTEVIDEPLYAHYLRVSGLQHPGREEVLASQEASGEKVIQELIYGSQARPVRFMKHMAHHLIALDESFLADTTNILLIRHPALVIASFAKVISRPTLSDIGIQRQHELFVQLRQQGQAPLVLDGPELLKNPRSVLHKTCERLGIAFDEAMLTWPAGPRPEDGVWAPYWYENVHRSTGFQPYQAKSVHLSPQLQALAEEAQPYYEALFAEALSAS